MNNCIKSHIEDHDALAKHLQITVDVSEEGYGKACMPLTEQHVNGVGMAHGGAIFALADVAFAAAANACMGSAILNAQTSISYLKGGSKGPLVAEARVIRRGKRLTTYQVDVCDAEGGLIAVATVTGYLTEIPLWRGASCKVE